MFNKLNRWFGRLLEAVSITILISLAFIVVLAVVFRYSGSSLVWYDEVASVQLAWLTYYGAALAALKRGHLGFSGLFLKLPVGIRSICFVIAEMFVIGFFCVIGWAGWHLLGVFGEETLVSIAWVPLKFTQSVIPIGAALFILAELFSIPDAWRNAMAGTDYEQRAIETAVKEAENAS
ncbi:MAG: TRAP transporter small permease [Desulfobacterales bacterium]|nr:TRAP transporter small permease [Desulfobacterales bacterium]